MRLWRLFGRCSGGLIKPLNDLYILLIIILEEEEKRTDGECSTLFIANLGPNCTETELHQYLSQYKGFNNLNVRARGGMSVAFADFERLEQATEAMNTLRLLTTII